MPAKDRAFLNVWDDTVSGRDLLISLAIATLLSLGGFLLTPWPAPGPLVLGIAGAILGFFISALLFRPKRRLDIEGEA
jgi:CHASE2 domain-containing sensor protein